MFGERKGLQTAHPAILNRARLVQEQKWNESQVHNTSTCPNCGPIHENLPSVSRFNLDMHVDNDKHMATILSNVESWYNKWLKWRLGRGYERRTNVDDCQ